MTKAQSARKETCVRNCSNYKGNRGTCQSPHYIRVDFLEEVVLGEIRRLTKFASLYEDEQKELTEKIKQLRSEIEKQSNRTMTTDMFISLVRKYTRAKKLTPRMLNELVEKIEVFNAEKVNGVWEQRLRIHYNCVGTIEIPSALPLPTPDVSVNTRKGVVVNYAPCDVAI